MPSLKHVQLTAKCHLSWADVWVPQAGVELSFSRAASVHCISLGMGQHHFSRVLQEKKSQDFFTIARRWSLVQIKVMVSRFRALPFALCLIYCCTCEAGSSHWSVFMWLLIPPNLCIKTRPNHLECQAAISIHDTWYANIHITAHTWRTFPAAAGDAHSESL